MRAALYARVSTTDQTCENQLIELRRYVDARGWLLNDPHVYIGAGVSGSRDRRPALDRMIADARRRRFDVLVGGFAEGTLRAQLSPHRPEARAGGASRPVQRAASNLRGVHKLKGANGSAMALPETSAAATATLAPFRGEWRCWHQSTSELQRR
jgi:hypothetical protein